jgi:hypothetical protein
MNHKAHFEARYRFSWSYCGKNTALAAKGLTKGHVCLCVCVCVCVLVEYLLLKQSKTGHLAVSNSWCCTVFKAQLLTQHGHNLWQVK